MFFNIRNYESVTNPTKIIFINTKIAYTLIFCYNKCNMETFLYYFNAATIIVAYVYTTLALHQIAVKFKMKNAWYAFIPFFNFSLMCQVIKRPWWWVFLLFVPLANTIVLIIVWIEFQKLKRKELPSFEPIIKNLFEK